MALKSVKEATKTLAKKAGKLPKAPKKPKRGASVAAMESYVARHNAWAHKISEMAKSAKKKDSLHKQIFK